MSERKRKLQDPEYEDFAISLPKQPHLSEEEVRKDTEERVRAIIRKHFATEERFREDQLATLQETLSRAQEMIAELRRVAVQQAYSRSQVMTTGQPLSKWAHQPSTDQTRIHPAIKKLLGWKKAPPLVTPGPSGQPTTRRAASKTTPLASQATSPLCSDGTISAASPSISKPSASRVNDFPSMSNIPSTSKLKTTPSLSQPSVGIDPSRSGNISLLENFGAGESAVGKTEDEETKGGVVKVPRHLPPQVLGAKPRRQLRMVGRVLKHLVVGNTSRCLSAESRPGRASHKWMLYVRFRDNQAAGLHVRHVVFTLHPSYAPNEVVKVSRPPFHLSRRGWGEFLARVNVHFVHPQDKPLEITHHLKLDHSGSGLERLGSETHVKVWLHEMEATHPTPTGEEDSESDEAATALPSPEDRQTLDHRPSNAAEADALSLAEDVAIKCEPPSPRVPSPMDLDADAALDFGNSIDAIDIKEEPLDISNSAMGLDIFYDDPTSFSEEVVEEVEIKEELIEEEVLEDDSPIYVDADGDALGRVQPEPVSESQASGVESADASAEPSRAPIVPGGAPSVANAIANAMPSVALPNGDLLIKLVKPGGEAVYMRMCRAPNGALGGSQGATANGRLPVKAASRVNGAGASAPGRSLLRSVLKPLAVRETSLKPASTESITLIGPLMTTDPLSGLLGRLNPDAAHAAHAPVKQEPVARGANLPQERCPDALRAVQQFMLTPQGLSAATAPHKEAVRRAALRCDCSRCPSVERALAVLASALPLADSRAARPAFRCVHPYAAPSVAAFLAWPAYKQRSAERQRAVAVHRLLSTLGRPAEDVWSARLIERWLRLHGFTPTPPPAQGEEVQGGESRRCSYSEPALALAWLAQLTERDADEPDVDVVTVDDGATATRSSVPVVQPDNSHMVTMPMAAEMQRRCEHLADVAREIGVHLHPEEIAEETLYHAASRVLLEAFQLFTEEILRRSLCQAWSRNRNRPPQSLEPEDVRAAVARHFPLLSNHGLAAVTTATTTTAGGQHS